jgi:tetratricopeptide (TPR) repeat protein
MRVLEMNGDNEGLLREAEAAVALALAEGLTQTEAYGLMARGTAHSSLGHAEAALADFERLAHLGTKLGDLETEGAGHAARATMLQRLGRGAEAIAALETARALFERCGQHFRLAMVQQQLSIAHLGQGHAAAALEAADAALRDALRVDAALDALAHCWLARAMALRSLGRYAEALAAVEPRLGELDVQRNWVADRLRLELAQSYVHLGRVDLAHRLLAQARAPARLASGEQQRALYVELQLRAFGSASAPLPARPGPAVEPRRRCELLRALAALAPAAERAALLDDALRTASEFGLADERCTAQAALAQHLLGAGQTQAAAELMRVALRDESVVPAGYPPAVAAIAHAVLGASGEGASARRVLEAAVAWIERASNELPPEFQSSFRERNPVNRALLAALGR